MYWELTMLCHFKVIADGQGHRHIYTQTQTHRQTGSTNNNIQGYTNDIDIQTLKTLK